MRHRRPGEATCTHEGRAHTMAKDIEDEVAYYYDFHPTEEDLMEETSKSDLQEKPGKYARMGVIEYFAYDPNERPLDRKAARRLFGWHLDPAEGVMQEMLLRPDGSLWSSQLQSVLVPQGEFLRLYDRQGHLRLTQAEAEARRAEVLAEKLRSLGIDPDQL